MENRDEIEKSNDRDLKQTRDKASRKIMDTQQNNKNYFGRRHRSVTKYQLGDYTLLKSNFHAPGVNKKLHPKYRGPYEISRVLPNDRYEVKDIEGMQIGRVPYKGVAAHFNMNPYLKCLSSKSDRVK